MRICANTLPQIAEYARSGRVVVFDTETTGYSLANLIEALNIDGINSHDAIDDTLACAGVFFALLS